MPRSPSVTATAGELAAARVLGVVRSASADAAVATARALLAGGVQVVEVALTTPGAVEAIRELARVDDGRIVGAGTVLDPASAGLAIDAGARFVVAPTTEIDTIRLCRRRGTMVIPGTQTPTEMLHAQEAGAHWVKLFPAGPLGPGYLRAVLSALPQLRVLPTGGIAPGEAGAWLEAGAAAVGFGGSLTAGSTSQVQQRAEALVAALPPV